MPEALSSTEGVEAYPPISIRTQDHIHSFSIVRARECDPLVVQVAFVLPFGEPYPSCVRAALPHYLGKEAHDIPLERSKVNFIKRLAGHVLTVSLGYSRSTVPKAEPRKVHSDQGNIREKC